METSDTELRCYFALNRFGLLSLGALRDALIAKVAQATIQKQQGLQDIYPTAPAALLITLLLYSAERSSSSAEACARSYSSLGITTIFL